MKWNIDVFRRLLVRFDKSHFYFSEFHAAFIMLLCCTTYSWGNDQPEHVPFVTVNVRCKVYKFRAPVLLYVGRSWCWFVGLQTQSRSVLAKTGRTTEDLDRSLSDSAADDYPRQYVVNAGREREKNSRQVQCTRAVAGCQERLTSILLTILSIQI